MSEAHNYVQSQTTPELEKEWLEQERKYLEAKRAAENRLKAVRAMLDKEMGVRG